MERRYRKTCHNCHRKAKGRCNSLKAPPITRGIAWQRSQGAVSSKQSVFVTFSHVQFCHFPVPLPLSRGCSVFHNATLLNWDGVVWSDTDELTSTYSRE